MKKIADSTRTQRTFRRTTRESPDACFLVDVQALNEITPTHP
jgi:hypothetical protein